MLPSLPKFLHGDEKQPAHAIVEHTSHCRFIATVLVLRVSYLYRQSTGCSVTDMPYYSKCLKWCVKSLGLDWQDENMCTAVDEMIQHNEFSRRLFLLSGANAEWLPEPQFVDTDWQKAMEAVTNKTNEVYLFTALLGAYRFYDE